MPAPNTPLILQALQGYRARLDAMELGMMQSMGDQWLLIEKRLEADMAALAYEMAERQATGKIITQQMVWRAERYKALQAKMQDELRKYSDDTAAGAISAAQKQYAMLGIDSAQAAINATYGPMGGYFNNINVGAMQSMIGLAGDGSPLRMLLRESYGDASKGLVDALVNGLARGLGPAKVALEMANGFGMGLDRALLIARTEAARAYRTASAEQYRQSGVVTGFKRLVHKSTACMACLMLDGEKFDSMDDELDDHPNGKCVIVPCVEGVADPKWQSGQAYFSSLSAEEQKARMGPGLYQAWKDGEFQLSDLAKKQHSDVWGDSPRVPSLKELRDNLTGTEVGDDSVENEANNN